MRSVGAFFLTLSMPLSVMSFLQSLTIAQPSLVGSDRSSSCLFVSDTPEILPEFADKKEYMDYMETVSSLPEGFAVGTAKGVSYYSSENEGAAVFHGKVEALTLLSFADFCIRRSSRSRKPSD